jgi:plastocyanin
MTFRLHICSNRGLRLFFLCAALLPGAVSAATLTGSVRLLGSGKATIHGDYSGVVVWLGPASGTGPPPQPGQFQMAQKKKHFTPPILAIPVGSSVSFPNFDPIYHNAFSNFAGQVFDVGLYPPGGDQKVRFSRPGVVRVFCNIHPAMSAVIVVVDTPYMAVSDTAGSFHIDNVNSGDYRFHVFHERATEQTLNRLERLLTVGEAPVSLPAIEISEKDYVPVSHKNKYGKDYPAVIEDRPMYPSVERP